MPAGDNRTGASGVHAVVEKRSRERDVSANLGIVVAEGGARLRLTVAAPLPVVKPM
jgi:hypothetical protein